MQKPRDGWQSGQSYDRFMGRWSLIVAREFLAWLSIPSQGAWLEVGCGTGAISDLIWRTQKTSEILAVDSSPEFIAFAREKHRDNLIQFEVGLAQSLPVESQHYDAVVSGIMLNFVPQPEQALAEMRRAAKPGGVVAAYVWDYAEGMQMLRYFWDAAAALDGEATALDEGLRFPLCQEGSLERLFVEAGLREAQFRPIEVPTGFSSFEEYWLPFLGGVGPAPSYVASLDDARRTALMEKLRENLPHSNDGRIALTARAWAVQGWV